jgi:branched-chain amino acid transport system ATP-binding protein
MRRTTVQSPRPRSARNPKHRPAHDVVGALQAEHQYASRLLDVLAERLAASSRGEALDREALRAGMSYMTEHVDGYHHLREDALFALLVKRAPDLARSIAKVKREHRSIGAAGKRLIAALERPARTARGDEAELISGVAGYVGAMRTHMDLEEGELFPRAREVLDEDDLAEIDRTFMRVIDPLFEASLQSAYAAYSPLVRYLAEQPVLQQVVGALDSALGSALTLGETLFGQAGRAAPEPARAERSRKAAR